MKKFFHKLTKIVFDIIFYILIAIILVLLGYMIVIKVLERQGRISEVPINFYTILSQSMYPTIKAGDVIITYRPKDNMYKVGDIITFVPSDNITNGITITHRIVDMYISNGEYVYSTKGDANSTADYLPLYRDNIVGKYIFKIPKAGFIQQFLVSRIGWLCVIVIPSLGIIIYDILKLFKKFDSNAKNKRKVYIKEEEKEELKQILDNNIIPDSNDEKLDDIYEDLDTNEVEVSNNEEEDSKY